VDADLEHCGSLSTNGQSSGHYRGFGFGHLVDRRSIGQDFGQIIGQRGIPACGNGKGKLPGEVAIVNLVVRAFVRYIVHRCDSFKGE
jgi:hypothetical protein